MTILCSTDEQGRPTLNGKLTAFIPACQWVPCDQPPLFCCHDPQTWTEPVTEESQETLLLEAAFTRHFVIAVRKGISTIGNQDHTARQLAPGCLLHSHSSPIPSHFFPSQEQAPTFTIFISEPLILLNYPFLGITYNSLGKMRSEPTTSTTAPSPSFLIMNFVNLVNC